MEQKPKSVSPFSNESRNTYVIEHLAESMLALLREKPIADISISELCDGAGVGRTSFYRNYKCKEDILRAHVRRMLDEWFSQWDGSDAPLHETIRRVFSHFEANRDFYSLLDRQGLVYLLKDAILDICKYDPLQDAASAYSVAFVAYSLYGWIEVWFRRGMRESVDELVELFSEHT